MYDPTLGHQFAVRGRYSYDKINLRKRRYEVVDEGHSTYQYLEVIELFLEVRRSLGHWDTGTVHEEMVAWFKDCLKLLQQKFRGWTTYVRMLSQALNPVCQRTAVYRLPGQWDPMLHFRNTN